MKTFLVAVALLAVSAQAFAARGSARCCRTMPRSRTRCTKTR